MFKDNFGRVIPLPTATPTIRAARIAKAQRDIEAAKAANNVVATMQAVCALYAAQALVTR